MSKHTPGPWKLTPNCNMPSGVTIYWVNQITTISTSNAADAKLIATAPELLDALIRLAQVSIEMVLSAHNYNEAVIAVKALNAETIAAGKAIRKAKGE